MVKVRQQKRQVRFEKEEKSTFPTISWSVLSDFLPVGRQGAVQSENRKSSAVFSQTKVRLVYLPVLFC